LDLGDGLAVRFIFPHAPRIPVSINDGHVMRAWYDVKTLDGTTRHVDEAGIRAACAGVRTLIARERGRGVPSTRIVLAGFSQGGGIAYTTGLTHPEPLGGIVALSAYMPAPGLIEEALLGPNRETPIFAAHGTEDNVLPLPLGEQARDFLLRWGYRLSWHTYAMPHTVCQEEIKALGAWLRAILVTR
jgi:phospholipase/carboxylesterase